MLLEAASYGVQALLRHGSWIMAFVLEGGILGYFAMQPHSTRHFALFGMCDCLRVEKRDMLRAFPSTLRHDFASPRGLLTS